MSRAIVLLSGGMDSAVALYWALEESGIVVVRIMTFEYGQRGSGLEWESASAIIKYAGLPRSLHIANHLDIKADCALQNPEASLEPDVVYAGLPTTYVPARNLILIAHAAAVAFEAEADMIIGGWNSVDTNYPDCRPTFLALTAQAAALSLGRFADQLQVYSPVQFMSKTDVVEMGERLGVPWKLTRSCYDGYEAPCLKCDSCLKRIKAFVEAGVRDPLVHLTALWAQFEVEYAKSE